MARVAWQRRAPRATEQRADEGHDAFLSYCRADRRVARVLQPAIERFATPWYRPRSLRVFRDESSMSAAPGLWPSIEEALKESRYFILLASPAAVASEWVPQEVEWWLEHRSLDRLLIAVAGGRLPWERTSTEQDPALPATLAAALSVEPRWTDVRSAGSADRMSTRDPRVREAAGDLAARIRGVPKDALVNDDIRYRRRALRLARGAALGLAVLAAVATIAAIIAFNERDRAEANERAARSRELAARASAARPLDPAGSVLMALRALGIDRTAEAEEALRRAIADTNVLAVMGSHGAAVTGADVEPGGTRVLTAGHDGRAEVWVPGARRPAFVLQHERRPGIFDGIEDARWSRDGKRIVTSSGSNARVWNASTGALLQELGPHRDALAGAFTDGERVLLASGAGTAKLRDAAQRGRGTVLRDTSGRRDWADPYVSGAAFSPDGRLLVAQAREGFATVWSVAPADAVAELDALVDLDDGAAFSPDGRFLVTGGEFGAYVSDAGTGRLLETLGGASRVSPAAFSADGRRFVTTSGGRAQVWSTATRTKARDLRHPLDATDAALNGDGSLAVTASSDGIGRVWEVSTGRPLLELRGHAGSLLSVRFMQGGRSVLTTSFDGTVRLWAVRLSRGVASAEGPINTMALDTSGSRLALGRADGAVDVWDLVARRRLHTLRHDDVLRRHYDPLPSPDEIVGVSFSRDGRRLLTEAEPHQPSRPTSLEVQILRARLLEGGTAKLWDAATGTLAREFDHGEAMSDAALSPDGKLVVTVGEGVARAWSTATGRQVGEVRLGGDFSPCVEFSPVGDRVVAAAATRVVVWDPHDATPRTTAWRAAGVDDVAFDPTGRLVATGGASTPAEVRDAVTGRRRFGLAAEAGNLQHIRFSPDGGLVLGIPGDGQGRVWSARDGRVLAELRHKVRSDEVAFSPDGRWLATPSGAAGQLWQARGGEDIGALQHRAVVGSSGSPSVVSVAFTRDGRSIFTAGDDGSVQMHDCDACGSLERVVALARSRVRSEPRGGEP